MLHRNCVVNIKTFYWHSKLVLFGRSYFGLNGDINYVCCLSHIIKAHLSFGRFEMKKTYQLKMHKLKKKQKKNQNGKWIVIFHTVGFGKVEQLFKNGINETLNLHKIFNTFGMEL